MHDHDLLELLDFGLDACAARLRVLIQQFHIIELLVKRHHHFEHHAPVLIEHVLLDCRAAIMARLVLVHNVVDDFAHLLLIRLKHLDLALHELSLAIHERLRDHIHILSLHELLSHFVQECIHLVVSDLL